MRNSHLYVGILGQRYGWVPDGEPDPDAKSITELEYEACVQNGRPAIKRLIFLRTKNEDKFTDAVSHRQTADRMYKFRERASKEQQPYQFDSVEQLRFELHKAVSAKKAEFHREKAPGQPIFDQRKVWHSALKPVVLLALPGSDDEFRTMLTAARPALFCDADISPSRGNLLVEAEKGIRKAQLACLLVTNPTLQRINEPAVAPRFDRLLKIMARRNGVAPVLCIDVDPAELPAAWRGIVPLRITASGLRESVEAVADQLYKNLRDVASLTTQTRLALSFLVVAPTQEEMETLTKGSAGFAGFTNVGIRKQRRGQFQQLRQAACAIHPKWPKDRYHTTREAWRCFDKNSGTVEEIIGGVVGTINTAHPGSRERELLQEAELLIRPYSLDEYLHDVDGSRRMIQEMCDRGCLLVVDETALLHPKLREAAEALLGTRRTAIVSISPCDPAHWPTNQLLGETSFLRVGAIVQRFKTEQDSQCEIALNSEERVRRWLRMAIPRLVIEIEGLASHPALVNRIDEHLT